MLRVVAWLIARHVRSRGGVRRRRGLRLASRVRVGHVPKLRISILALQRRQGRVLRRGLLLLRLLLLSGSLLAHSAKRGQARWLLLLTLLLRRLLTRRWLLTLALLRRRQAVGRVRLVSRVEVVVIHIGNGCEGWRSSEKEWDSEGMLVLDLQPHRMDVQAFDPRLEIEASSE